MSLTLAVLSWGARKTLVNTLESYRKQNLDAPGTEKIVFFQEITNEDREIAQEYGYEAHGVPINIGIAQGYKSLVELATGDLFLFLENDWELIEPVDAAYEAANLLYNEVVDVVRLRHRENPGNPLWSRTYQGRELDKPEYILDSIHWTDPERFPQIHLDDHFYFTTAPFANWTNNPTMFRTQWLKDVVVPRMGNSDVEIEIQPWWREQREIRVAQHEIGLFTHNRIDR